MEKRDLYDRHRNLTGETIFKGEKIPDDRYIVVVLVFIQNSDGKFLIQKRSEIKNGKYATTGGHPKSRESSIEGIISEVKEEIGLDLKPENLKLYYSNRSDVEKVFWDDYYIKMDVENIDNLELQEEEVDSVCWLDINEIKMLMKEGKFFKNHYEEFEILLDWLENKKISNREYGFYNKIKNWDFSNINYIEENLTNWDMYDILKTTRTVNQRFWI